MILLQNRLIVAEVEISGLHKLIQILNSENKQVLLSGDWNRIRQKDYIPVVDPAIAILETLPSDSHTESLLNIIVESVIECAPKIMGWQLDYAGPLYHSLLETARYDGSFYTSSAAAVLLSELAIPEDWNSMIDRKWNEASAIAQLKICDPACGTGTLLMSSAKVLEDRFRLSGGEKTHYPLLHIGLIEDVLHGMDINRHAIHLSASMLTLSAPEIDYNKINLFNMWHGKANDGSWRAGSLELLVHDATLLPELMPRPTSKRTGRMGYTEEEIPDLKSMCDLVIMNPPFTRNDIRNKWLQENAQKAVQGREKAISKKAPEKIYRDAIKNTSVQTFFIPIADMLTNSTGTVAMVAPFTVCTSPGAQGQRHLLMDRFHVEVVVTSHDNRRIFFSENTDIHESLIVARRKNNLNQGKSTAFVSLATNPSGTSDAQLLANAIHQALSGNRVPLSDFGTIDWRMPEQLEGRIWNAVCFYDQSLASEYDRLRNCESLVKIGGKKVGLVGPSGRSIRGNFVKSVTRQNPDIRCLWDNKSERQVSMRTSPDSFLVPKNKKWTAAMRLKEKRSHLMVVERMRLNLTRTPAVFSNTPILGSAFTTVTPLSGNNKEIQKAWCVWLNSTLGVLGFLNIRQKQLTYPGFSMEAIRSLFVPNPVKCDIAGLSRAFDLYADMPLKPFPQIDKDDVRLKLDEVVIECVPGLPWADIDHLRQRIADEPTVNIQVIEDV